MKLIYSKNALTQLENILNFLVFEQDIPLDKASEIRNDLLEKAEILILNPKIGQFEEHLQRLKSGHRRIVIRNYKIIYIIKREEIIITDIFDARQDPKKMKG